MAGQIAYVMKHLDFPLVDAYFIVHSRHLSVVIQPNMRQLYNLLEWEVKLAQERAKQYSVFPSCFLSEYYNASAIWASNGSMTPLCKIVSQRTNS